MAAMNGTPELAGLLADQNLTATLKLLEAAIGSAEAEYANAAARLAQLHINKGYCHQCLSLSRKALKVWDCHGMQLRGDLPRQHACICMHPKDCMHGVMCGNAVSWQAAC